MTPLRVGIIGPGKVAALHAAAVVGLDEARLAGVSGRRPEPTQAFAREWGTTAYAGVDEMVGSGAVDAVIICTPHPGHCDQAVRAASAGAHVLVEKPMALTVDECDRMIEAAQRAGVVLSVVSQRRWHEPVQRMKAAIDSGKIGRPAIGTVALLGWRGAEYYAMDPWRGTREGEGGGVLVNQAVHHLDLLLWMMGGPLEGVSAYTANVNHPQIEVEDSAVAALRFQGGALGAIVASNSQRPGVHGKVHVHGDLGFSVGVQTDGGSSFVAGVSETIELPRNDLWTIPGEEELPAVWRSEDEQSAHGRDLIAHYHRLQVADFVAAARDGRPAGVTGEDGRRAVELIEAVYACADGGPVGLIST
ncbi:MAG TPA: Gfo/Idh/MocA family oxidoreductase [Egibacteraceae bacterium]|nr:Gfo/Idh/MocA family oxidoreductase [Egibacteraceae bacterium]